MFGGQPGDGSAVRTCSCGRMLTTWRDGTRRGIAVYPCNLGGKSRPRQRVPRMGVSREGTIPTAPSIGVVSGLWRLFEAGPLRQMRGPLHDVIFEVGVRDLVLRSLHPPAHGNPGLVNGVGIARNKRMPPIEIAALGYDLLAAIWLEPVQGWVV